MSDTPQVLVSDDALIIERMEIRNADLCSYLQGFAPNEQAERVRDALIIGAEVLQKARARSEVDYIDKRFAEVSKEFGERINQVVTGTTSGLNSLVTKTKDELTKLLSPRDDGSPLKERFEAVDALVGKIKAELAAEHAKVQESAAALATQFDINGGDASHLVKLKKHVEDFEGRVSSMFNPEVASSFLYRVFDPKAGTLPTLLDSKLAFADASSPFGQFKEEVKIKLNDMREKVVESIGNLKAELEAYRAQIGQAAADREKMSAKGDDFEAAALDLLAPFAEKRGDTVERVGDEAETGTSKKGDLNYRFGSNAGLVAIEAKNKKITSIRAFTDELLKGVRNRGAGFGILLVRDADHLQKSIGEWHFDISPDGVGYIITHAGLIELSLKFAHARLRYAAAEVAGVDASALRVLVNAMTTKLKEASGIRGNLTALETTIEKIRLQLDSIVDTVRDHLEDFEEQIARGEPKAG